VTCFVPENPGPRVTQGTAMMASSYSELSGVQCNVCAGCVTCFVPEHPGPRVTQGTAMMASSYSELSGVQCNVCAGCATCCVPEHPVVFLDILDRVSPRARQ